MEITKRGLIAGLLGVAATGPVMAACAVGDGLAGFQVGSGLTAGQLAAEGAAIDAYLADLLPETLAMIARRPDLSALRIRCLDQLVRDLKACASWERIDTIYDFRAPSESLALLNLKASTDWRAL